MAKMMVHTGLGWRTVAATLLLALAALILGASPAFAEGTVTVSVQGRGDAGGPGIDCNESGGPDCAEFYADQTFQECDPERRPPCFTVTEPPFVEVTAGADRAGYVFEGWTGCDTVSLRTCQMTVTASRGVTARFSDVQAPAISGLSPGSGLRTGTISISANANDNSGAVSRVEFRVRGVLVATDTSAPFGASFNTASVADGAAAIRATAFDATGNSAFAESNITIDNTAPTLNVTGGPDGQTFGPGSTQTWTFSAGDANLSSVQCSVVPAGSQASFGACSGGSGSHSVANRPGGEYTFAVRARDGVGLETVRGRSFSIDAVAPETTITSGVADGARTNQTSLTWGFSSSEAGSTFECRVYPAALTPPAFGPCSAAGSHTASGLSSRTYALEVRSRDTFGNLESTPVKRTFTVDTIAPTVLRTTPIGTRVPPTTNVTATFSEAMNRSSLTRTTVRLVRRGTASAVPATVTASADGKTVTLNPVRNLVAGATYTATVTRGAKDVAGNTLAANKNWSFTVRR